MDNKLNEITRKIRFLRTEMLDAEDNIRKRVNRDEDSSEAAVHLMSMRVVMLGLISERNRLGGEAAAQCRRAVQLDVPRGQPKTFERGAVRFPANAGDLIGVRTGRCQENASLKHSEPSSALARNGKGPRSPWA